MPKNLKSHRIWWCHEKIVTSAFFMSSELTTKLGVSGGQVSSSYNLSFMRYLGAYMPPPV